MKKEKKTERKIIVDLDILRYVQYQIFFKNGFKRFEIVPANAKKPTRVKNWPVK